MSAPPAAPTNLSAVATSRHQGVALPPGTKALTKSNHMGYVIQRCSTDGVTFGVKSVRLQQRTSRTTPPLRARPTPISSMPRAARAIHSTLRPRLLRRPPSPPPRRISLPSPFRQRKLILETWTDTAAGIETGFHHPAAIPVPALCRSERPAAGVTSFSDTTVSANQTYTYQVVATSAGGNSAPVPPRRPTTPLATSITTYLSDLNWVNSATAAAGTPCRRISALPAIRSN